MLGQTFVSTLPEVKEPSLNLKGESGDLWNKRKAITFQGVIIRLSYHMCDDPFLCLKWMQKGSLLKLPLPDFSSSRFFLQKYRNWYHKTNFMFDSVAVFGALYIAVGWYWEWPPPLQFPCPSSPILNVSPVISHNVQWTITNSYRFNSWRAEGLFNAV